MKIGVPKEILDQEHRVGLTPDSVLALTSAGHTVIVQSGAGLGSGFSDEEYLSCGGQIGSTAEYVYANSRLIVKVKQPLAADLAYLSAEHILFTFLHLAAEPHLAESLRSIGLRAFAYETITDPVQPHSLPVLMPMSEIAGKMSVQIGAHLLEKAQGGSGILLSGSSGIAKGIVTILGGGIAGCCAAQISKGMGADVCIFEKRHSRLRELEHHLGDGVRVLLPQVNSISQRVRQSDLVIGAVLIPGRRPPTLVTAEDVKAMRPGSVILDIAIDQGGCIETIRPTTHTDPTFSLYGVTHYGVTNMPGAVPRTSTLALNAVTLDLVEQLAESDGNTDLSGGLNIIDGQIVHHDVKAALGG